jgi:murein DD-endopeptidase MepM/ murein hydrolase activator NlpD
VIRPERRRLRGFARLPVLLPVLLACAHPAPPAPPPAGAAPPNPYESASPDTAASWKRVRLPLPSRTRFVVSQGAFGRASHRQRGIEHRWDFDVPYGTPVVSMERGQVIAVRQWHQPGGCDPRFAETPNSILIQHADGTVAQYVHVESRVRVGQKVGEGEVVAVTGKNGFICAPQLDFLVYRSDKTLYDSPVRESIPLRFGGVPRELAVQRLAGVVP